MLKVCILGQANPFAWMPHYVSAFREVCDVITVGPRLDAATLPGTRREQLAEMIQPHDREIALDQIEDLRQVLPAGWTPDLVVSITSGGIPMYRNTATLNCPAVLISVDTWQCVTDHVDARYYDVVFTAQREYVQHLRASGSRYVYWLPLACNPLAHFPVEQERETHDIAFVGSASLSVHAERAKLLSRLAQICSVIHAEQVYGREMCHLFARGRLAFNHSAVRDLNMRIFEVLAMGRPLLTNIESANNGLLDLFTDGKDLIAYRDEDDLIKKVEFYLSRDTLRRAVGASGRAKVLHEHTYQHRVHTLLQLVRNLCPTLGRDTGRSPESRFERLADFLPRIPGIVIDLGMKLSLSKYSARKLGVTQFIGVSANSDRRDQRRGSYDELHDRLDCFQNSSVDTIVISDESEILHSDSVMSHIYRILESGGTLQGEMSLGRLADWTNKPPTMETCKEWLLSMGFCLTLFGVSPKGTVLFSARKRLRSVREITYEVFSELQLEDFPADKIASMVPEDM